MAAEFFDDKLLSFGYTTFGVYETRNLTYDEFVNYELVVNLAQFDATIAIWKEKARWDAVRPFTAIPYLYGDQKITAYCGKGKSQHHISVALLVHNTEYTFPYFKQDKVLAMTFPPMFGTRTCLLLTTLSTHL